MSALAWVAVGAFVAAVVARMVEPSAPKPDFSRASTWFTLAKELCMWGVVVWVLA